MRLRLVALGWPASLCTATWLPIIACNMALLAGKYFIQGQCAYYDKTARNWPKAVWLLGAPLSASAGAQVEAFRKKDLALLGAFAPDSPELAAFLAAADAMREDFDCAHVLDASLLAEVRIATAFTLCTKQGIGCCYCMQV